MQYGNFESKIILFGLSNTPTYFQTCVNQILTKKLDMFMIIYLDDILIYTHNNGKSQVEAIW